MSTASARVLLLGGNSGIAQHLLDLLPDARALARTGTGPRVTSISDYRDLSPADFDGVQTVISCLGIVHGRQAELDSINADLQVAMATAARDAGVSRFVAIGSFSMFGSVASITMDTQQEPVDPYGRSKRKGYEMLVSLQTPSFDTLTVAFPAIIGTTRAGKVVRMLKLWRRAGAWVMPPGDVTRSMIGVQAAARTLAHAASSQYAGYVLAADPAMFSYQAVARWLREDVGGTFRLWEAPRAAVTALKNVGPSLYRSMMTDSRLEPASNYMIECGLESSLRRELVGALSSGSRRP